MKTKGKKAAKNSETGKKGAKAAAVAVAETLAPPPPVSLAPAPAPAEPAVIDVAPSAPAASARKPISTEERRRLIALAAYRRAETIGFGKTNPLEDWLVAERTVDAMLGSEVRI